MRTPRLPCSLSACWSALSSFPKAFRSSSSRTPSAWVAGVLAGAFGGLVGNQGGIRSAALLGFDVRKETFVATATVIGLIVDAVRMPVYFFTEADAIGRVWPLVALATAGVLVGTVVGERVLKLIPEPIFRRVVSLLLLGLGISLLIGALTGGSSRGSASAAADEACSGGTAVGLEQYASG